MRKILLLAATFLVTGNIYAQSDHLFEDNYPDSKTILGLDADYAISSDAVKASFVNSYINNKFLDKDLKDGSYDGMKSRALLGSYLDGGIFLSHRKEKIGKMEDVTLFLSIRQRSHFNTNFTTDLFGLYFYGNKMFAGKKADISDLHYRGIQYQQLQFGFNKTIAGKSGDWELSMALSFLNGMDYLEITTDRGSVYTDPDGFYADLDLQLKSKQSDTTSNSFGTSDGIGGSMDLGISYSKDKKYRFTFSVKDLGFIAWNNKSNSFEVDTVYHFEGVTVNNLFDSLYLDIQSEQEFVNGFKENKKSESFTTLLPVRIDASFEKELITDKLKGTIAAQYILNSDFSPLILIGGDYFFNTKTMAGLNVSYGGYSKFNAGINIGKDFGKGYILHLSSNFITGYITPSNATAQGAYASIKKIF